MRVRGRRREGMVGCSEWGDGVGGDGIMGVGRVARVDRMRAGMVSIDVERYKHTHRQLRTFKRRWKS